MSEERKTFQELSYEENPHFLQDGNQIYGFLQCKYPNKSTKDLDNILNALCAALVIHIKGNVDECDFKPSTQLVYKILERNL